MLTDLVVFGEFLICIESLCRIKTESKRLKNTKAERDKPDRKEKVETCLSEFANSFIFSPLQPSVSGMEPPFGDAFQNYSFADQALTSTELLATSSDPDFMYELVSVYAHALPPQRGRATNKAAGLANLPLNLSSLHISHAELSPARV